MSYSYYKSSSRSSGTPRAGLPDDAEFQAAKMQAMMNAPPEGSGSHSYSYRSSSSSALPTSPLNMDSEMRRMEREMRGSLHPIGSDGGTVSSSYSSTSSGTHSPKSIHIQQEPASSGTSVKKVVTTTTTKSNPQAVREMERLERDFNRIGKTPDDYHDDFDKIKREIDSGAAYREDVGHTTRLHSTPSSGGNRQEVTTTTTTTYDAPRGRQAKQDISETFIPIRTYDKSFDDFHMNRWQDHRDHFGPISSPDLDAHRLDWENQLRGVKNDMFKFSPRTDFGDTAIESSRTVSKKKRPLRRSQSMRTTRTYYVDCVSTRNPLGNPEFSIQFDMRDFKADDISLTTKNGKLIISATHEDKIGKSTSRREFTRSVDLPADIQINMMRSVFSRDGILSITAPIKPPHYDPVTKPIVQSAFSSQQAPLMFNAPFSRHEPLMSSNSFTNQEYAPATSSQSTPAYPTTSQATQPYYSGQTSPKDASSSTSDDTHKSMDYTLPVSGYLPEELEVCVERRKVKVQGKHVENRIGGRKTHNVFTKIFDLPSYVDADDVRCYVKDGHTLHVVAHVGHDIQGLVHFLPVTKK